MPRQRIADSGLLRRYVEAMLPSDEMLYDSASATPVRDVYAEARWQADTSTHHTRFSIGAMMTLMIKSLAARRAPDEGCRLRACYLSCRRASYADADDMPPAPMSEDSEPYDEAKMMMPRLAMMMVDDGGRHEWRAILCMLWRYKMREARYAEDERLRADDERGERRYASLADAYC